MSVKALLARGTTLVLRKESDLPLAFWPLHNMVWSGYDTVRALHTGLIVPVADGIDPIIARSPSTTMTVPLIARMTQSTPAVRLRLQSVSFSVQNLFVRELGCCAYCGYATQRSKANESDSATFDHVYPRSRGGKNNWYNAVLACAECNCKKADRTPEEAGMLLRIKPWSPTPVEMLKLRIQMFPLKSPEWLAYTPLPDTPRTDAAFEFATS